MHSNVARTALASTLLLACNNPAPIDDWDETAGASAALGLPGNACQLAEGGGESSPERTRGLYTLEAPSGAGAGRLSNAYTNGALPCGSALAGSYGARVELDVYTQDEAAAAEHDPGRGDAALLLRADIEPGPNNREAEVTLQLCGLDLPPRYAYASSSVTQIKLPDATWDQSSMPVWKSHLHATRSGDGQLQLDTFAILLGITLREQGAPWPSFEQTPAFDCGADNKGIDCFPDHDADGEPGLSVHFQTEGAVEDAPYPACADWQPRGPSTHDHVWSAGADAEASRLFVGLRTALQLSLTFDATCGQATGDARAADIMMRTFDCELNDGQRCSPRQATVVDERAPVFHVLEPGETPPPSFHDSRHFVDDALDRAPSAGGRVTLRRLPKADARCQAVRAIFAQ